ncbi:hypothetical protein DFR68_12275 [Nocardia mexicana]|uniref:Post-GPI attachment to proteins factor 3 n=2 Tax=Nocardia mexicana TaxID=279262 RepID=A0A370GHR3_9NOCA|nr:hypothetical protein DFR68_12275 [Nocardia mexicana]
MLDRYDLRLRWTHLCDALIRPYLYAYGVGFACFWTWGLIVSATGAHVPLWMNEFFLWNHGHNRDPAAAMFSVVGLVWMVFLLRGVKNLAQNHLLVDFTIAASCAHFALMTIMSTYMPDHRAHLYKDTLMGWVVTLPLVVIWLTVRKEYVAFYETVSWAIAFESDSAAGRQP